MRNLVKSFVLLIALAMSGVVLSQEGAGSFDIGSMIKQMKLSKADMARMIDQLVQAGQIKPEEGKAAKAKLLQMNDSDMDKLKLEAVELYKKNSDNPSKMLDPKTKKALESLKSNINDNELTEKLRQLDEDDI